METKEAALPAPPFHQLLNQLHRMKKLNGVITTNVDGLEYKEADMSGRRDISVPSELLNPESRKVLQLHGNVYTGLCIPGGCKVPLTSAQVGPLCTPMDPLPSQRHLWGIPCPNCASNPNRKPRAASSGRVYRPDMIFFHDKERLQSDEELILMKELLGEAQGFSKPDLLVIAGTSLRIDGLLTMANSVAKTTKTLIINTSWEPPFTQLDTNVKWEQTDANAWAEEILNGVDCNMS
jgi:NAD-dependent SIR2 family protein deacetylase